MRNQGRVAEAAVVLQALSPETLSPETLAPEAASPEVMLTAADDAALSAHGDLAHILLAERRLRHSMLPRAIAQEPGWEIILELYLTHCAGRTLSVSDVFIGSSIPATTALRHIKQLAADGYVERIRDHDDARRNYLSITPAVFAQVDAYLVQCAEVRASTGL